MPIVAVRCFVVVFLLIKAEIYKSKRYLTFVRIITTNGRASTSRNCPLKIHKNVRNFRNAQSQSPRGVLLKLRVQMSGMDFLWKLHTAREVLSKSSLMRFQSSTIQLRSKKCLFKYFSPLNNWEKKSASHSYRIVIYVINPLSDDDDDQVGRAFVLTEFYRWINKKKNFFLRARSVFLLSRRLKLATNDPLCAVKKKKIIKIKIPSQIPCRRLLQASSHWTNIAGWTYHGRSLQDKNDDHTEHARKQNHDREQSLQSESQASPLSSSKQKEVSKRIEI